MTIFQKIYKKPYFRVILGPFCQNLVKNEFFLEKEDLSVFKYSNYLPSCKKSQKTNDPFLGKNAELTDRQTVIGDFIGPSVGRESNKMH